MTPTSRKHSKSADKKKALETDQYAKRALRNSWKAPFLDISQGMIGEIVEEQKSFVCKVFHRLVWPDQQ